MKYASITYCMEAVNYIGNRAFVLLILHLKKTKQFRFLQSHTSLKHISSACKDHILSAVSMCYH